MTILTFYKLSSDELQFSEKDSREQVDSAENAEQIDLLYVKCMERFFKAKTEAEFDDLKNKFEKMSGYRNSDEYLSQCEKELKKLASRKESKKQISKSVLIVSAILILLIPAAVFGVFKIKTANAISKMEENSVTLNMLLKEASNVYLADIKTTTYNGKTAEEATVNDVLIQNDLTDISDYLTCTIGNNTYCMVWNTDSGSGQVAINGGDYEADGTVLTGDTTIKSLADQIS